MNDHTLSSPVFNPQTPTPARVYDYYLGGKDNFPADREAGEKVIKAFPHGGGQVHMVRRRLVAGRLVWV
jgi:ABC-type sugar transport system substrate-binding protein